MPFTETGLANRPSLLVGEAGRLDLRPAVFVGGRLDILI